MASAPEIRTPPAAARHKDAAEPPRRRQAIPAPGLPHWRRGLNVLLVFVTIVLVVDALVGEKGLVETVRARRLYREELATVEKLRQENARVRQLADRLQKDPSTIESIARHELGLIKPGEILVILKNVRPRNQSGFARGAR